GIRDKLVTGVQTCALPISVHGPARAAQAPAEAAARGGNQDAAADGGASRLEARPGFAGVRRTLGGVGGHFGAPHLLKSRPLADRSEERRVGKGGGARGWWS